MSGTATGTGTDVDELGRLMVAEMAEQPAVLRRLLAKFDDLAGEIRSLAGRHPRGVAFLARGSSDNAALLGRYAVELYTGLPTCLVAPSVLTAYRRRPDGFAGWVLVALSQSGRTPEIVTLAGQFAQAGATVIGVTNAAGSELADVSDLHLDVAAGAELAVPATKTVTGQMLAVLAIASGLSDDGLPAARVTGSGAGAGGIAGLPAAVDAVLADSAAPRRIAAELAHYDRLAVVGRGACYPAALETSLKLQETTGVMAHGFSSADFRHGPIAVCGPGAPAVLLAGSGPADDDTRALRAELAARGADTILIGTGPDVAAGWPELGPAGECILATVRGQQLAYALAVGRGIDPDHPGGLKKVTLTH
jgi:glucosamine--fructose-6-phosphate aminotransferase (isomerizing)